ncbi:hypothetical protein [Chitinophaga sp. 212800010-3]|uniref:hypothetical protein n=1 Tax=unclassified Chitinophaga TaxID=2619133 RepID=UPI002DE97565|nr:Lipocalin-like domain-containing protein [Chitinophaga sp. 212800010-3]
MSHLYAFVLAFIINLGCTNLPSEQNNGNIAGKWMPVRSVMSATENGEKSYEKTDTSFSSIDLMHFKPNGELEDGGQRYEGYTYNRQTKELTLHESNGDGITFLVRTLTSQQMIIVREDEEQYNNKRRHMKLEIYFKKR